MQVSPSTVRSDKEVVLQVRGFPSNTSVLVTISDGVTVINVPLTTDKQGRAKTKIPAPPVSSATYVVTATGGTPPQTASTTLTVVEKK